jgi:hypothetical protein
LSLINDKRIAARVEKFTHAIALTNRFAKSNHAAHALLWIFLRRAHSILGQLTNSKCRIQRSGAGAELAARRQIAL